MIGSTDIEGTQRVLCFQWHSTYDVITAGGFKRTFEIFKRTPGGFDITAIDNSPSFLWGVASERLRVIEYDFPRWIKRMETGHFLLERILEWALAPFYMLYLALKLKVKGNRYDVIFIPSSEIIPSLVAGVAAKYIFRARLVCCNMNIELFSPFMVSIVAWLHNRAELVITLSNDLKSHLRERGVTMPIVINATGLDIPFIEEATGKGEKGKKYDAVFVGRHIQAKGVFDLIEAWSILTESFPEAKLLMIGSCDPDHRERLTRLIGDRNLEDNVIMKRTVEEGEKFRLMRMSKVCLFPSYVEGWGIVPQEGLACGLPVVVYDLPVYEENVKPCPAVFSVDVGDYREMAARTVELLTDSKYLQYEKVGPPFVSKYNWDEVAQTEFGFIR